MFTHIFSLLKAKKFSIALYVVFALILVVMCLLKVNTHVDETLTFTLSNEPNSTAIVLQQGVKFEDPARLFAEAFSTDSNSRFDYINVWDNQTKDVHPPLYYVIVHTICSLFPSQFSLWQVAVINIFFMLLTLFVVRKIIKLLTDSAVVSCLLSVAFMITGGFLSAVTFYRMYIMAMFLVALTAYLFLRLTKQRETWLSYIPLMIAIYCGALTHYYCIVFAVFISVVYGVYLIVEKKWKPIVVFSLSMGITGVLSYLSFPPMIRHLFFGSRGSEALQNLSSQSGYLGRLKNFFSIIDDQLFGGLLIYIIVAGVLFLLLTVLLRTRCKQENDVAFPSKELIKKYVLLLVPSFLFYIIVAKMAAYQTDRYISPIYPVLFVAVFCLIGEFLQRITPQKGVALLMCLLVTVTSLQSLRNTNFTYLYRQSNTFLEKTSAYADVDCLCIYDQSYRVQASYKELSQYKSITFLSVNDLDRLSELSVSSNDKLVVTICGTDKNYVQRVLSDCSNLNKSKHLGSYSYSNSYYLSE